MELAERGHDSHDSQRQVARGWNLERISFVDRIQTTSIAKDFHPIFRSSQRLSRAAFRLSTRSVVGIKLSSFIMWSGYLAQDQGQ